MEPTVGPRWTVLRSRTGRLYLGSNLTPRFDRVAAEISFPSLQHLVIGAACLDLLATVRVDLDLKFLAGALTGGGVGLAREAREKRSHRK